MKKFTENEVWKDARREKRINYKISKWRRNKRARARVCMSVCMLSRNPEIGKHRELEKLGKRRKRGMVRDHEHGGSISCGCEITTFRIKWQRDTYGSESKLIVSQHGTGDYNGM